MREVCWRRSRAVRASCTSRRRRAPRPVAPHRVQALHEYHAHNAFEALILLEKVSSRCAGEGQCGTILALRADLSSQGAKSSAVSSMIHARCAHFRRKLGEALARPETTWTPKGCFARRSIWPVRTVKIGARPRALAHVAVGRDVGWRLRFTCARRWISRSARRARARELARKIEKADGGVTRVGASSAALVCVCVFASLVPRDLTTRASA